ncbi:hypothetical protein BD410DRAFT_843029 [Rickenella mellea]|uniref:Uncharacterized protein n=1 Tax=Rickenella mellea TaxID=50990 RepID=A0A4Y7PRX5_9AGAM|nr:hypothetical protein BD410DRAFT_843029 [Rickenella mellea]
MNQGSARYASTGYRAQKGTAVVGRSKPEQFKITECRVKGTCTVGPTDKLSFGLSDVQLENPVGQQSRVQLHDIPNDEPKKSLWYIIPVD